MEREITQFVRRNWNIDYLEDIVSGRGFTISEPAETIIDREKVKSLYGANSPLYGTSYDDEQSFIERYQCRCGAFRGKEFENGTCPLCDTVVQYKDMDIEFTGWIDLGTNKVINPYYFRLLSSVLGRSNFNELIFTNHRVDRDGNTSLYIVDDKPSHPYVGLGIEGFHNKFEEVMEYFRKKKKDKSKNIDTLLEERRKVFVTKVPICSKFLRPQSRSKENFYFTTIDKEIATLFTLSENLKENLNELEKTYVIQRIQNRVNTMWNIHFNTIDGKDGYVRKLVLGAEMNYTSRNVIVPDPTLNENEVDISYQTMLELYKYRIIYYLMQTEDVTLTEAYNIWSQGFRFDEKIYQIMEYIVNNEKCYLVINRNPTINFYSLLLMKIRNIIRDPEVYVLSVPLSILPGLNADQQRSGAIVI